MADNIAEKIILKDLGDGLILRRATPADTDDLAAFNGDIHRNPGDPDPEEDVIYWVRDLMSGTHPTFRPEDFTIVEDTKNGKIVSTLNLISQHWQYGGIEFSVGRPELVGTLPDYRRRGLIRAQFDAVHRWSAERGELVQGITGIPYYYRQFGYEMAMDLGGGRYGYKPTVTPLKEGEQEPYRFRAATANDIPFMMSVYNQASRRYLVTCLHDESAWRYELCGRSTQSGERREWRIIEKQDGEAIGYLSHDWKIRGKSTLNFNAYELKAGIPWAQVTPSLLRYVQKTGEELAASETKPPKREWQVMGFWLGGDHPAYQVMQDRLPNPRTPYAWYMRVPDLPAFLRKIQPVLQQRLNQSVFAGFDGEVKVSFYRDGLCIGCERGQITKIEKWLPWPDHGEQAAFPGLTFLQLLFGYRNLVELKYAFADCWAGETAGPFLQVLFPKQPSVVWPIS